MTATSMPARLRRRSLLVLAGGLVAGRTAAATPSSGKDVSGEHLGGVLDLPDAAGRVRRLAEFRGKVLLLFFGYTRCPDVCPTTLVRVAEAVRRLAPDEASRVRVLWATVDPERDSPELVGRYVQAFNPAFIGLSGSVAQTDVVAAAFRFRYDVTTYRNDVLVSHSPDGFVIDARGRTRVRIGVDATPEQIERDVHALLAET
ncbi:MAG TPA: SCO family protein [Burkholderiaceae bacterium]